MKLAIVQKLPKSAQRVGNVYFTQNCYYQPYFDFRFGFVLYRRYKRDFM